MGKKVWVGVAAGVVGGLVASAAMDQFQVLVKKVQKPQNAEPPSAEGEPATVRAAEGLVEPVLHRKLTEDEKKVAGPAMHYAMGAVSGGIYGAVAAAFPVAAAGFGSLFGAVLWAIADEVVVPALGLSKSPTEYPPEVHANALASHVVYGISTDLVRRLIAGRLLSA
jgi:putative membrane protein